MAVSEPKITFNIIPASQVIEIADHRTLIVGQKLAGGTAPPDVLMQNFPSDKSEDSLFGTRSHLAGLVRAFKKENRVSPLDVIPLDDPASTAGTGIVQFSGTAAESGTYEVSVGSKKYHKFNVTVAKDDVGDTIGTTLETAAALDLTAPFQGVNLSGTVTFTAEHNGTLANEWGIEVIGVIAGVTVTITHWANGTSSPLLTGVLDQIANIRYRSIVWPASYDIEIVQDDLDAKFNTSNNVLDGVAIQAKSDTLANLRSYVAPLNSQSVVIIGQHEVNRLALKGPASMEMLDEISSQVSAIRALRFSTGANLTRYLTATAPRDQFGGGHLASLPYFNTLLPNMPVATPQDEFDGEELSELSENGVANLGPNRVFNGTIFGTFVTTYLTDPAANPDESYKFLNTVDAASVVREFYFLNGRSRYAQSRLTTGDLLAGYSMANAASIRAFCKRLYDELASVAITAAGISAKKDFDDNLIIEVTTSGGNGTAFITMAPPLVTGFRVVLGTIQINFGEALI